MNPTMISHSVEISIVERVEEMVCALTSMSFFSFFLFKKDIFIVPTIEEMTCILTIWPKQNRKSNNL